MTLTITLPNEIVTRLEHKAHEQHRSVEAVALDLLARALQGEEAYPTPEQVVAKMKATAPNLSNIRPPSGSLADALRHAPTDPEFNLEEWEQAWALVEAELKSITRANNQAEGLA